MKIAACSLGWLWLTAGLVSADWAGPYDLDAYTVGLYHLDAASGGTVADSTGFHNGTLRGGAAITTGAAGVFGEALQLDGDGDYVVLGNLHQSPAVSYEAGTVESWVKLTAAPDYFVVLNSGTSYGSSWDDGWFLGKHAGYGSNLVFMMWNGGWQVADSGIHPSTLVGEWHHLAGTWGPRGLEVWIDGEKVGTNGFTGTGNNPNYVAAHLGTDSWTWDTAGWIDEVRISSIQREFTPIPEPGAGAAILAGLALLAGLRRSNRPRARTPVR